jgi:hypothetical protein
VRTAMWEGRISQDHLRLLDQAPGFSWIERHGASKEAVSACVEHVSRVAGRMAFGDRHARHQDTGLTNTLRALDDIYDQCSELFEDVDESIREDLRKVGAG